MVTTTAERVDELEKQVEMKLGKMLISEIEVCVVLKPAIYTNFPCLFSRIPLNL